MSPEILIVDDDPVQRRLVEAHLTRIGYRCSSFDDGRPALEALSRDGKRFSAMVLDLVMPGLGGLEVMAEMRKLRLSLPVVVQTAKGGVEAVVEAMRAGAFDFVVKPASAERLAAAVGDAVRVAQAGLSPAARKAGKDQPPGTGGPALSAAMRPVMAQALKAAASTIPVLIEGETGVGKEWLAETIRTAGPRANGPFVVVNCGALPHALVESILFGHEKGAFTDAAEKRVGKFVEADGGTLLLDEIGDLPQDMQVKLLRVLQKGEVDPIGARHSVRTDVRVLSATHRDLAQEVRAGRFREDLYYRLSVLPIRVPPLRERREEISGLAHAFLSRLAGSEPSAGALILSNNAIELLCAHDWPGNIRQLENAIHRAVVLATGPELRAEDFPQLSAIDLASLVGEAETAAERGSPVAPQSTVAFETSEAEASAGEAFSARTGALAAFDGAGEVRTAEAVEADLIRIAMERYDGRMTEIARRLGIGRSTLYRKMRQYRIAPPL